MTLPDALRRDLLLSVGTHKGIRPLSPIEVANGLQEAIRMGMTVEQLGSLLHLDGPSMIARFLGLARLAPDISHLVDWGRKDQLLSMTSASEIARLAKPDQVVVAEKALEFGFGKEEVRQVIQLRIRSREPIEDCIKKIVALRPTIERKFVFVGAIRDPIATARLREKSQVDRDQMFRGVLLQHIPDLRAFTARLGTGKFTILGDETVNKAIGSLQPDFEALISSWIEDELRNERAGNG